jgi:ElaB/YqjD/DUF883 family membrane-anchored ribosome-binding protein
VKNGNEGQTYTPKEHLEAAACELLNEGKKRVNHLCEEGINKVSETEDTIKECSDRLLKKVQENPLASVLIAGGIGFLLSKLMKK